jgi:hypothetical protein
VDALAEALARDLDLGQFRAFGNYRQRRVSMVSPAAAPAPLKSISS